MDGEALTADLEGLREEREEALPEVFLAEEEEEFFLPPEDDLFLPDEFLL